MLINPDMVCCPQGGFTQGYILSDPFSMPLVTQATNTHRILVWKMCAVRSFLCQSMKFLWRL